MATTRWPLTAVSSPSMPGSTARKPPPPQRPGCRDGGDARRAGVLAGGIRRRGVRPWRCRLLRLPSDDAPERPGGGDGGHTRREGLLAGGLRRRRVRPRRRRVLRLVARSTRHTPRWWGWRRPPTGTATGWWPPTARCSPKETPASSARKPALTSTPRLWGWRRRPTGRGIGWWRPTAGCSPTAMPASSAPRRRRA